MKLSGANGSIKIRSAREVSKVKSPWLFASVRIALLLVGLILLGIFACPPRAYAPFSYPTTPSAFSEPGG